MFDLLIRGGTVVTPDWTGPADVAVQGEKIAAVGLPGSLDGQAQRVLDATGRIVVPGGVEPHAHLHHFISMYPDRDLYTMGPEDDTRGMAFGGTTTHVDFCFIRPGSDLQQTLQQRLDRWKGRSYVDYSFHVVLGGALPLSTFDQIPDLIRQGFPSFKVFTSDVLPPHPKRPPYRLDFGRIQIAMEKVAANGGIMMVHAEDHDLVQTMYEKLQGEGQDAAPNMPLVHSKTSELLATRRVVQLAERTKAAVYFAHISAREGVETIAEARGRGLPVYGETLHHYLTFDAKEYREPHGRVYHTYPSLKYQEDRDALWNGLLTGRMSMVGTDEFPTTLELKLLGDRVSNVTGGNLGAEARMGIVYSEGVAKRGMSLEQFCAVTSANAARILGLYPRKGAIAPGSDADIALIDPSVRKTLAKSDFHVADYSPWEGWQVQGWPVATVLRGKVIVEQGRLSGSLTDGRLIPRKVDQAVITRPAL